MRILVATFTYWPNVNGVATAAEQIVKTFRNCGHEVVVATGACQTVSPNPIREDVNTHRFSIAGAPAIGAGFSGEIDRYQNFILSLDPDFVIFHCWDTWPCELALPLRRQIRSKFILVSHGYSAHLLNFSILPRGLWKWLHWLPHVLSLPKRMRQFDKIVFLSPKIDLNRFFDAWVAQVTRCRKTTVIPNAIETFNWAKIPANFRERERLGEGVIFLCVANYFPGKNQQMALDAFILASIPSSILLFIGSKLGTYGESVRESWNQSKKAYPQLDVRFYEGMERDQVISATKSCDVAILASKTEAQPLTILEAMACGKPFICTNVGCVSELKGGVIIRGIDQLAAAMHDLAANPDRRMQKGTEARNDFHASYSIEAISQVWLRLVEELA